MNDVSDYRSARYRGCYGVGRTWRWLTEVDVYDVSRKKRNIGGGRWVL